MPSSSTRRSTALHLVPLALALAGGGTGCYRATGESRPTVVSEQIPATGGDLVLGNKATGGAGDYYLGNDNVHLAVDGAVFGDRPGQFGAPSGGAILDIGGIALDQSFKRVPLATDNVERLGPVVNQDPDLPLVFESYATSSSNEAATLSMKGHLLDSKHKLAGVSWDASGRVLGLEVEHSITLRNAERSFDILTTLRNTGASALPVRNIGDYLHQSGGGLRFVVPAVTDASGTAISTWGVEIPGSDFTDPLGTTSVQAPLVALMGSEPSAPSYDMHQSLGIMPLDQTPVVNPDKNLVLVTSDPQHALTEDRPRFPARLVVGSLPAAGIAAGATMSYKRRIHQGSGPSGINLVPAQASGILNFMAADKSRTSGGSLGLVSFTTAGSAVLRGPRQSEIRLERYQGLSADPSTDPSQANWILERVEWREAGENYGSSAFGLTPTLLPAVVDAAHSGLTQAYRVTISNRDEGETGYFFNKAVVGGITGVPSQVRPTVTTPFQIADLLSPERSQVTADSGAGLSRRFLSHGFNAVMGAPVGAVSTAYQPLRITFAGVDASGAFDASKDPDHARVRSMSGTYDVVTKAKIFAGLNHGAYQFTAGNQIFGSSFLPTEAAAAFYFTKGSYVAMGTQGPLSALSQIPIEVSTSAAFGTHTFLVFPSPIPAGWTSFDMPGPSQITTGGMLPAEQLSSALAEGVQVVGRTELDRHADADGLAKEFLQEFDSVTAGRRQAIDGQLFTLNARTSVLGGETATALFTPALAAGQPLGGARSTKGWTLADFAAQAEGKYTVLHHPKGHEADFAAVDAIELLRGEGCDPANPSAWFADFKAARTQWFDALSHQAPTAFTKGLGLSSGVFSLDTPVGLARTYLKTGSATLSQSDLSSVLATLQSGAAVASTGPLLDVNLNGSAGPGSLLAGPAGSVTLNIDLWAPDWMPVQEVRVVVNGVVVQTLDPATFTASTQHSRLRSTTLTLDLAAAAGGKDAWVVVEAGVPLATSGAYAVNTPWNKVMKGIYPVAVANPIFVDVNGSGYTPPLP